MLRDETGWHIKYRPKTWGEVVGQDAAVKALVGYGDKVPHAIMATGQTGGGKTTTLRILAAQLGCPEGSKMAYSEINCASVSSPLEVVRQLDDARTGSVLGAARCRVYLLDEIQAWVRSKGAQEALLKILEDIPPHIYYFLATTDPAKIIKPIHNRCAKITFKAVAAADLKKLLRRVSEAEGVKFDDRVTDLLVEEANGSPRALLVEAQRIAGIPDKDRAASIGKSGAEKVAFDLVKALIPFKGGPQWRDVAAVLMDCEEEDPEGLRQMVLACARGRLLKGGSDAQMCYKTIKCLDSPFYDRNSGKALLAAACYNIVFGTQQR